MGLLRFVKLAGAKIFGATKTAAAPPSKGRKRPGNTVSTRRKSRSSPRETKSSSRAAATRSREVRAGYRRSGAVAVRSRQVLSRPSAADSSVSDRE
jgi:hypothetical protein